MCRELGGRCVGEEGDVCRELGGRGGGRGV